jgi:hypothetical protein
MFVLLKSFSDGLQTLMVTLDVFGYQVAIGIVAGVSSEKQ